MLLIRGTTPLRRLLTMLVNPPRPVPSSPTKLIMAGLVDGLELTASPPGGSPGITKSKMGVRSGSKDTTASATWNDDGQDLVFMTADSVEDGHDEKLLNSLGKQQDVKVR